MYKIGDIINVGYHHDNYENNHQNGKITWVHPFKYYPNGDPNEFVMKTQVKVIFDDGDELILIDPNKKKPDTRTHKERQNFCEAYQN